MGRCDDLMIGQVTRLLDAWMLCEVTWCSDYDAADFTDADRDQCRISETGYAERDIGAFINQPNLSIEQVKPQGHSGVSVDESVDDRSDQFARVDRRRQRHNAARCRPLARGDFVGLCEVAQDPTADDDVTFACFA